jgi:triosephosphate isomerase (TIM)
MANARKYMIAGNWKMNLTVDEGLRLVERLDSKVGRQTSVDVVVAPSFIALHQTANLLKWSKIRVSAQNMSEFESGAYTGDVSPGMLLTSGCSDVILGHSERRGHFSESDELIGRKVALALANQLTPIICVGETADERDRSETESVLRRQLQGAFPDSVAGSVTEGKEVIVAYEPVWAIGTGKVATPEIAQNSHEFVRGWLGENLSAKIADSTRILYGGSVKPDNAAGLLAQQDIDGALVGGCSLKADEFSVIVEATPGYNSEAVLESGTAESA